MVSSVAVDELKSAICTGVEKKIKYGTDEVQREDGKELFKVSLKSLYNMDDPLNARVEIYSITTSDPQIKRGDFVGGIEGLVIGAFQGNIWMKCKSIVGAQKGTSVEEELFS